MTLAQKKQRAKGLAKKVDAYEKLQRDFEDFKKMIETTKSPYLEFSVSSTGRGSARINLSNTHTPVIGNLLVTFAELNLMLLESEIKMFDLNEELEEANGQ